MDKFDIIQDMARDLDRELGNFWESATHISENLYEKGWRKLRDDEVVLSRDQIARMFAEIRDSKK